MFNGIQVNIIESSNAWTRPAQGVTGWLLGPGVMAHGLLL